MDLNGARDFIVQRLRSELNPTLFYHCLDHTLDVLEAIRRLNESENIDGHSRILLETAALYHDAGMLTQYRDHETVSIKLAEKILPGFGYQKQDIEHIAGLIMATKLPQMAVHLHEQIICDADLDYLGRDDFFINSFKLRLEWQMNDIKKTTLKEWFHVQVDFLTEHHYFTKSASALRDETKLRNLVEVRAVLSDK